MNNPLWGGWCAAPCVSVIMMADWQNAGRSRRGGPGPPAGRCWRRGKDGGGGVGGDNTEPTGVSVRVCWTGFSATLQKFANEITPVLFYRSKSLNFYSLEGCRFRFPVPAEVKTVFKINLLFARCVVVEGGDKETCAGCNFPQFASFEIHLWENKWRRLKGLTVWCKGVIAPVFIGRSTGL